MRTFLNAGSLESHSFGQKLDCRDDLVHVFLELPPRPWTKMKSISGAVGEYRRLSPNGPFRPSALSSEVVDVLASVFDRENRLLERLVESPLLEGLSGCRSGFALRCFRKNLYSQRPGRIEVSQ